MAGSGKGRTARPVRAKSARGVDAREVFLAALAEGFSATSAARKASLARSTVYLWRDTDPDFAKAWAEAEESGSDLLEDEALRRASHGVKKPVYYQGAVVGEVEAYDSALLMFLLKARRPEKYKDSFKAEISDDKSASATLTDTEREARIRSLFAIAAERERQSAAPKATDDDSNDSD